MAAVISNPRSNQQQTHLGTLYVVATPIGNLDDLSDRMRHTLARVDRIAAEDTRRTKQLLSHIGVDTPCFSMHDHNERQKIDWVVQLLEGGESIALVSDAGTPLISDPGYPLVSTLREKNIPIVAIPGACALITALSIAGLPSDRFVFEGFLPAKSAGRIARFKAVYQETATLIIYESSHRIMACLADIESVFGKERTIVVARELTKTFETVISGSAPEILEVLQADHNQTKGEFVVMIAGASKKKSELSAEAKQLAEKLCVYLPKKQAAKISAEIHDEKKNSIYQYLLSLGEGDL